MNNSRNLFVLGFSIFFGLMIEKWIQFYDRSEGDQVNFQVHMFFYGHEFCGRVSLTYILSHLIRVFQIWTSFWKFYWVPVCSHLVFLVASLTIFYQVWIYSNTWLRKIYLFRQQSWSWYYRLERRTRRRWVSWWNGQRRLWSTIC